jgi:hypothetical protein
MSDLPSKLRVESLIAPIIKEFLVGLTREIPESKFIYDEALSYRTAVESFRSKNSLDKECTDLFPLFAFRRSVLRYASDGHQRRSVSSDRAVRESVQTVAGVEVHRILHGEFDIDFLYLCRSVEDQERFEISYLSEEGISSIKELDIGFSPLFVPDFKLKYYPKYDILTDKVIEHQGNHFQTVSGKVTIRGYFLTFRADAKVILEIGETLRSFGGDILHQRTLT